MLTTDDLKKIQGVMREEIGTSETKLKQEINGSETKLRGVISEEIGNSEIKIRAEVGNLETKLRKVIHEEVDKRAQETELKMEFRFNAVDKQLHEVRKQQEQDRKDWSDFFNEAGIFFDEMRTQLVKRIKKLEDKQAISNN